LGPHTGHQRSVLDSQLLGRQKKLDIRVIIGNPPYSIGQGSQNDNNQNVSYQHLDGRIRATYSERSAAALSKGLYPESVTSIDAGRYWMARA
jgi:predicted helicase